jgi:hypothetical protein
MLDAPGSGKAIKGYNCEKKGILRGGYYFSIGRGSDRKENKINGVAITDDTISNRCGLSFMLRYIDKARVPTMIEDRFDHLRKKQ